MVDDIIELSKLQREVERRFRDRRAAEQLDEPFEGDRRITDRRAAPCNEIDWQNQMFELIHCDSSRRTEMLEKVARAKHMTALWLTFIILALCLWFIPAHADVLALPQANDGWSVCQQGICAWGAGHPDPYLRVVPQPRNVDDMNAAQQRIMRWKERCKPVIHLDALGVRRFSYAAPRCEFGDDGEYE